MSEGQKTIEFKGREFLVELSSTPIMPGFIETADGIDKIVELSLGIDVKVKGSSGRFYDPTHFDSVQYWAILEDENHDPKSRNHRPLHFSDEE